MGSGGAKGGWNLSNSSIPLPIPLFLLLHTPKFKAKLIWWSDKDDPEPGGSAEPWGDRNSSSPTNPPLGWELG